MFWIKHVIIGETEAGLMYENGRFVRTLSPGRHRLVALPWLRQEVRRIDLRRTQIGLHGQEMLTADGISVRLNVTVEFRVADPVRAVHGVADYLNTLYTAVQVLLREEVQARTIDQLLADRSGMSAVILERGQSQAMELGLELVSVGVRDFILPGEVKRMLSREVEAQRAGRAALVAAREETAATRAKANTAQLLESNPVLLRLREIEALGQVAQGQGNTVVLAVPGEMLNGLKR